MCTTPGSTGFVAGEVFPSCIKIGISSGWSMHRVLELAAPRRLNSGYADLSFSAKLLWPSLCLQTWGREGSPPTQLITVYNKGFTSIPLHPVHCAAALPVSSACHNIHRTLIRYWELHRGDNNSISVGLLEQLQEFMQLLPLLLDCAVDQTWAGLNGLSICLTSSF
jgi:hypothetical protein